MKYPPKRKLTPEQVTELILKAQAGDIAARNEIVVANMRAVAEIAARYAASCGKYDAIDDFVQAGVIGLIEAVERFDVARGFRFSTYARHRVKYHIQRELTDRVDYDTGWDLDADINGVTNWGDNGIETQTDAHLTALELERALQTMPPLQRQVIEGLYVLDKSVADIAAELGRDHSTISKAHDAGLQRLHESLRRRMISKRQIAARLAA